MLEYQVNISLKIKKTELIDLKLKKIINLILQCKQIFNQSFFDNWKYKSLVDFFMIRENTKTSNIEGINTTIDDNYFIEENQLNKWSNSSKKLPLFLHLRKNFEKLNSFFIKPNYEDVNLSINDLKEFHKILFDNIKDKKVLSSSLIGEFKKTTNKIVSFNKETGEQKIIFVPCDTLILIDELSKLEKLINDPQFENIENIIINSGLIHAFFERIHPFTDGNGRLGRALIPIYFVIQKVFSFPIVFLSWSFFETRTVYYEMLKSIDENLSYEKWINYYLDCLIKTFDFYIYSSKMIDHLYFKNVDLLSTFDTLYIKKSKETISKILLSRPYFTYKSFLKQWEKINPETKPLGKGTLIKIFKELVNKGILSRSSRGSEKININELKKKRNIIYENKNFFFKG